MNTEESIKPGLALIFLLMLTAFIYWPGLQGGFLFDDYPNLETLGTYGGVVNLSTLKSFVFSGFSGPTGRPVSLLSFLLDDNTWPSYAGWFKKTNLFIHLVVGASVCWATLLLLRLYSVESRQAFWIAVLSSGLWLVHPYFVSTTLYVVQRMAQLATLFMLAGMIGYFYGRLLLLRRPVVAYCCMTLSIGLGTLFAVFSKENGVLLPFLILVIEFCKPQTNLPAPRVWWRALMLWLPSIVILGGLASLVNFSPDAWPSRSFDQPQRLLSECRILWEYLFHLYVPRVEGRGLFQDGYPISKGWLTPISTVYSAVGLVLLIGSAVALRKRWPLYGVAILFFFVSHLIESTLVGLELYFEHRNYAASIFLFLPLACGLVFFSGKTRPLIAVLISFVVFLVPVLMTWQRASLWADTDKLEMFWAYSTPESPRAHNAIAGYLFDRGRVDEANRELVEASKLLPDSALLTIRLLLQKVYSGVALGEDFRSAAEKLKYQPFDAQAVKGLRLLVEKVIEPSARPIYRDQTLAAIEAMSSNPHYKKFPLFVRLMPYLKARIYLAQNHPEHAYEQYLRAMTLYNDTEAALMMVAEMAQSDEQAFALRLLPQAQRIFRDQRISGLRRSPAEYADEFSRLENDLLQDIARKNSVVPAG